MIKLVLIATFLAIATCNDGRRHAEDPFAILDRHITHTLTHHYLWPWSQLIKAAAALDAEDHLEEPQIISDDKHFEINMNVKRFKPEELRVKVKNRYIIVEGKHKEANDEKKFMANHFVQRFVLPQGSKQDEVKAVLKENGVLNISALKHEIPPPPPEIEVPIEVMLPVEKTTETEKIETSTEKKVPLVIFTTTSPPLEQLELTEATAHIGKIRKKDLKTTIKTNKDNEVTKESEGNGLDYSLLEADE